MEKNIDIFYNSENGRQEFQIASGYISETRVLFEKEQIVALIRAKGVVEFYDRDGEHLATVVAPAEESGKQVYTRCFCDVQDGALEIGLPICQWIDNYPNCDGEHDRWDVEIVGWYILSYNPAECCVSVKKAL